VGDFAIAKTSKSRENNTFLGLGLDENLRLRDAEPRCGLFVIDLRTRDIVHWLRIEGIVEELYDVVILPGVQRPMAVGFKTDDNSTNCNNWFGFVEVSLYPIKRKKLLA